MAADQHQTREINRINFLLNYSSIKRCHRTAHNHRRSSNPDVEKMNSCKRLVEDFPSQITDAVVAPRKAFLFA